MIANEILTSSGLTNLDQAVIVFASEGIASKPPCKYTVFAASVLVPPDAAGKSDTLFTSIKYECNSLYCNLKERDGWYLWKKFKEMHHPLDKTILVEYINKSPKNKSLDLVNYDIMKLNYDPILVDLMKLLYDNVTNFIISISLTVAPLIKISFGADVICCKLPYT